MSHSFLGLILPGAVDSQTLQIPLAPPGCWIRVVSPSGQDYDANITILKRKTMDFSKELEQKVKEAIEAVPEAVASTAKRYFCLLYTSDAADE